MLMPKRVKYRKQMRGRMKGTELRGADVHFGDLGLQALEPGWVTVEQLCMHSSDVGKFGFGFSPINHTPKSPLKRVWVRVKET